MDCGEWNLRHLQAAVAVAETRSVSASAQAVNLTQPAVTQGIARLERSIGLPLFERSSDGMIATDAAHILLPRARSALGWIASSRVTAAQVRAFVALARHGSYSAAAAATGLRDPTLHRAVSDLSLALGEKLVSRRGRSITLTANGHAVARRFRLALAELRSAMSELQALQGREVGRITIGAMPLARARLLPDSVSKFCRDYPEVDIAIIEGSHAELIGPLRDGEIDFTIGALRDPPPGQDLVQRALFTDHPVVIARADHPLANLGRAPSAEELARFGWVIAGERTPLRSQWRNVFERNGIKPPRIAVECGAVIMIRQLLLDSDLLSLLSPDQVAVELEAGWLVSLGRAPGNPCRQIGLTMRAGWTPTRLQQALVATLEQEGVMIDISHN
jgi:DNA-binding transcriptional LysR family regulator